MNLRKNKNRSLRVENLEGRELFAADLGLVADIEVIRPGLEIVDDILIPADPWTGTWTHGNDATRGITKFEISKAANGEYEVEAWGSCTPTDCEWGKTELTVMGTSVNDLSENDFAIGTWDQGFKDATITVERVGGTMFVELYNMYQDDSGRSDFRMKYSLESDGEIRDVYTIHNDKLDDILVGGWVNVDENTRGITSLKYTNSFFGGPRVEGFGSCHPTDCEWGTTSVDLLGTSISSDYPVNTVSTWEFDHANKTLVSRPGANGELVADVYTEFTDGSNRSDYHSEYRFKKVGDVNGDGLFNSSDFVEVFAAGEFEDGIDGNSTWNEGDWNGDGDADTSDLVYAFQCGGYEADPVPMHTPTLTPLPLPFPGRPGIDLIPNGELPGVEPLPDPIDPWENLGFAGRFDFDILGDQEPELGRERVGDMAAVQGPAVIGADVADLLFAKF